VKNFLYSILWVALRPLIVWPNQAFRWIYDVVGLTKTLSLTDRYIRLRPGDTFVLAVMTFLFAQIGNTAVFVLWISDSMSTNIAVSASGVCTLLPPLVTKVICDAAMRYRVKKEREYAQRDREKVKAKSRQE